MSRGAAVGMPPWAAVVLPVVVLAGTVTLLQAHAIAFWTKAFESVPLGVGTSLLLEAIAIWSWADRTKIRWVVGIVASALLLAGPLWQVAEPLLQRNLSEVQDVSQREKTVALLEAEIDGLQRQLDSYIALRMQGAVGWHQRIDETRRRLDERRDMLREVLERRDSAGMNWYRKTLIWMHGIMLVLFQVGSAMAVVALSRLLFVREAPRHVASGHEPETIRPLVPGPGAVKPKKSGAAPSVDEVERIAKALADYLARAGMSQAAFAAKYGFRPRDLSLVMNHRRLVAEGKRTAAVGEIARLEGLLAEMEAALSDSGA